jgi:hypothetical protein
MIVLLWRLGRHDKWQGDGDAIQVKGVFGLPAAIFEFSNPIGRR